MANRPTVGGSDGTWGTELNAHLDVSLDDDGKVDDGAAQTTSAAPGADAELANKKYTDDQIATKSFGTSTPNDNSPSALAVNTVYQVSGDGFVNVRTLKGGINVSSIIGYSDGSNPPTTEITRQEDTSLQTMGLNIMFPVKSGNYWKATAVGVGTALIMWTPVGSGECSTP